MSFTREDWQSDLQDKVKFVVPKLKQKGITSGYAVIAASALLPMLISGAGWFPVLVSLVGNIGANLIANQIQDAKDEVDIAQKIQNLPDNHPLNIQIKLLLEKLDAFNIASQGLPEGDWVRLERLLDEKLSRIGTSHIINEPTVFSPIIHEKVSGTQARQVARQHFVDTWWAEKTHGKTTVFLTHVPTALYRAKCYATLQVKEKEDQRDSNGNFLGKVTVVTNETTNSIPIRLILFPVGVSQKSSSLIQEKLYKAINKLALSDEIEWDRKSFASWGYKTFIAPMRHPSSPDGIKGAEHNIGYWFENKETYETKPSTLPIQREKINNDARYAVEEILAEKNNVNNVITGRSLLGVRFGDEEIDFAQYPFWIFEVSSPGFAKIIVDGLTGEIQYSCMKPNFMAKVVFSIITLFIIMIILIVCLGLSMLAMSFFK